ncbi:hypothetical protein P153DRAFT_433293 [Dothidotthia symphoricarpi CBS 119687]|uniref:Uncharacterized protein n=1 Tax=Dothidotthia symphoricarpi CBS 119687 TaxID=1392245 RepID=A0A6A6A7J1_9PLEO|nr:uncharacterized protein P153DRAFT_433293 [Dothidotthia symphoricarpi CBS 119687]KAF2126777.1 hypothetical protein P153DRAFT_433293 [Dothidotthia symphoricarpi CBS 119687]
MAFHEPLSRLYIGCMQSFRDLLQVIIAKDSSADDTQEVRLHELQEEYGRLQIWGNQSGADLSPGAQESLENKLRHDEELNELSRSILQRMNDLLSQGMYLYHNTGISYQPALANTLVNRTNDNDNAAALNYNSTSCTSSDSDSESECDAGIPPHRKSRFSLLFQHLKEQTRLLYDLSSLLRRPDDSNQYVQAINQRQPISNLIPKTATNEFEDIEHTSYHSPFSFSVSTGQQGLSNVAKAEEGKIQYDHHEDVPQQGKPPSVGSHPYPDRLSQPEPTSQVVDEDILEQWLRQDDEQPGDGLTQADIFDPSIFKKKETTRDVLENWEDRRRDDLQDWEDRRRDDLQDWEDRHRDFLQDWEDRYNTTPVPQAEFFSPKELERDNLPNVQAVDSNEGDQAHDDAAYKHRKTQPYSYPQQLPYHLPGLKSTEAIPSGSRLRSVRNVKPGEVPQPKIKQSLGQYREDVYKQKPSEPSWQQNLSPLSTRPRGRSSLESLKLPIRHPGTLNVVSSSSQLPQRSMNVGTSLLALSLPGNVARRRLVLDLLTRAKGGHTGTCISASLRESAVYTVPIADRKLISDEYVDQ